MSSSADPARAEDSGFSESSCGRSTTREQTIKIEERRHSDAGRKRRWWNRIVGRRNKKHEWWFASTAIPLLAATLGPLANVLSISALVTYWRMDLLVNGEIVSELDGVPFEDPRWCYWLNAASLICGFVGNFFLLMNFTQKIPYIIALPMTIILWYMATGLLTAITICMDVYVPPSRPLQTYTQGYWYAVMAAIVYFICSMILMINMVGYWRGHYPQTFTLTESQRMLIIQTMLFFVWLAGGGAIFSRIETLHGHEEWTFVNGLYFCDVTILTVGFGDLYPTNDISRGLVFPYSVGGTIMLGLVISSIYNFATDISKEKVIKKHVNKIRSRTLDRTVTSSLELRRRETELERELNSGVRPVISRPFNPVDRSASTRIMPNRQRHTAIGRTVPHFRGVTTLKPTALNPMAQSRKPRLLLLREEKDRFDAMRSIQHSTMRFKQWYALTLSVCAFGILWAVGAVAFWQAEKDTQDMTYFQALYFCYVSLLTIGYGDASPKSAAGRAFFVVWSLVAVPTMTLLISDLGDTVISGFKDSSNRLADFTVLPKKNLWWDFLNKNPWLLNWLQRRKERKEQRKRMKQGIPIGPPEEELDVEDGGHSHDDENENGPSSISDLTQTGPARAADAQLVRRLAAAIKRVVSDLKADKPRKYNYEEWVEFTRLIRFTAEKKEDGYWEEEEESLIEWDWIGEDSPMMREGGESEFVMDALLESLGRFLRRGDVVERAEKMEKLGEAIESGVEAERNGRAGG